MNEDFFEVLNEWNDTQGAAYRLRAADLSWNRTQQNLVIYEPARIGGVHCIYAVASAAGTEAGLSVKSLWLTLWGRIVAGKELEFVQAVETFAAARGSTRIVIGGDEFHCVPGAPLDGDDGARMRTALGHADFDGSEAADFTGHVRTEQVSRYIAEAGHIFGTAVLIGISIYQQKALEQIVVIPHDSLTWFGLIFFGILQATVYLLVYKGFSKGQVGVLSPVFASFAGLTAILSIVVFGETISQYALFGLAILFVGILMINIDLPALQSRRFKITRVPGIKEVGIATLLAAVWTLSWDKFVGGQDWLSYALLMYAFMTLAILIFASTRRINLFVVPSSVWKFLILIGICETVAYAAISLGYSQTSLTSIISLLSGAFSLPTIILAHLFLKEKITKVQTIGSIVIVIGIMILSYYN